VSTALRSIEVDDAPEAVLDAFVTRAWCD